MDICIFCFYIVIVVKRLNLGFTVFVHYAWRVKVYKARNEPIRLNMTTQRAVDFTFVIIDLKGVVIFIAETLLEV